jgi:exodeoxyribonuclease VII large subunit
MSAPPTNIQAFRLSDLTALISDAINQTFRGRSYWVIAEVNDHRYKADKNYHFFTLVEKDPNTHEVLAKIGAGAWGSGSKAISQFKQETGQTFTNHIQVLVNVNVQYHPVYGLSVSLNQIDANFTLGALARQRQENLQRLVAENSEFVQKVGDTYITRNKQLHLNGVIQKIAVVCSDTSAGWQDFKHTLDNNPHKYAFSIDPYFTVVQGEGNAQHLVEALIAVFNSAKPYDAVVIVRGGGAQTDFLLFDQYIVGKAIAKFPIPIITGIGHQRDESIADLMAHRATKAPTDAAKLIIDHNRSFEERVQQFQQRIIISTQQRFSGALQRITQLQTGIINRTRSQLSDGKDFLNHTEQIVVNKTKSILLERHRQLLQASVSLSTRPRVAVADKVKDLQRITASMRTILPIYLQNKKGYLAHHVTLINALSPERTLKRGFAMVKVGGVVTSDPNKVIVGKDIDIILSQKVLTATVKNKKDYNGTSSLSKT